MRKLFKENIVFIVGYLTVLFTLLVLKLLYSKEELFLFVNTHNSAFGDSFFSIITHAGDGISIILFTILMLWVSYRYALLSLLIYTISSQIVQILKRGFFSSYPRPSKYFEGQVNLHFVDGVQIHQMMSFPSGHTTSIFALMSFLAIVTKNKSMGLVYLIIACVTAYSRIYLAQHFLEDTMVGSIIGVLSAFVITYVLETYSWYKSDWLNLSLRKNK